MPKQVDHAERRELIADAVLAVVARGGLEEASVRHVAAEAGVSVGMVQHYFRTKDELMRCALERVGARVQARMGEGVETPREMLRALFRQLLPLDEERAREGRVVLAFLAYATVRPEVGAELRADSSALRAHFAAGVVGSPLSPEVAAAGLFALLDGLGVQVLSGQLSVEAALETFDAFVELVLPLDI
ncbi:TetR/AcrR family transcriptional regulator [Pseudonocardia pini]|uniref:TetR/AcrR family transcriptional regulator n=1 Tax=Pseudonocardia pini TaxID=2758030 RepID=UPI0015F0D9C1|nr:TetR family transcriptional regulator C-terminal domain-containing protein [Pseudonocardia pini]